MNNDQTIGYIILLGSIAGIVIYFWLLFLAPTSWTMLTIQLSAFIAVMGVLGIIAWIGYTMATTPPPIPPEDMDLDFDWDEEEEEEPREEIEEES
jgi:predicted DNA-binding transcriptional regulator